MDRLAVRITRIDPAFATIIRMAGPVEWRDPSVDAFNALMRAIVFQQLAGRAASAIHGRVVALFGEQQPSPQALLQLSEEELRGAGLSAAKHRALVDLAKKFHDGTVPVDDIEQLDDEEVIARLSTIRGIGRWTAEMFLMFQLHRPDVWPVDDLGVRNGWARIHGTRALPTPKQLRELGEPFHPMRSAVAWYCWRAVHTLTPA